MRYNYLMSFIWRLTIENEFSTPSIISLALIAFANYPELFNVTLLVDPSYKSPLAFFLHRIGDGSFIFPHIFYFFGSV